jgi:uncharacterized membrane protein YkvI
MTTINEESHVNWKGILFAFLVIFLITAVFVVWYTNQRAANQEEMTTKGCTPAAWNSWGGVTLWDCPVKNIG